MATSNPSGCLFLLLGFFWEGIEKVGRMPNRITLEGELEFWNEIVTQFPHSPWERFLEPKKKKIWEMLAHEYARSVVKAKGAGKAIVAQARKEHCDALCEHIMAGGELSERVILSLDKKALKRVRECQKRFVKRKAINDVKIPKRKVAMSVSSRMLQVLKNKKASREWEMLVGYTVDELVQHLEKQFKPGMSWENHGQWHIDHIRPVSSFTFESIHDPAVKKCWALENLQPLWAYENMRKNAKYDGPLD